MEHQSGWLLTLLTALLWLAGAIVAVLAGRQIWQAGRLRPLRIHSYHGLVTTICILLVPVSIQRVGHTDGFNGWKLVPIISATPAVMLALIIWSLVARQRSVEPADRWTAPFFSACALILLVVGADFVFRGNQPFSEPSGEEQTGAQQSRRAIGPYCR